MKRDLKKGMWFAAAPGKTPAEKFPPVKEAGFDGMEVPSHLNQDEVLSARDKSGLLIATVSCGQWARAITNPDPAKRAEGVEGMKQAVRDAKRYGATSILAVPGGVSAEVNYADAYQRAHDGIKQVLPLAEELGIVIAFENVQGDFLLSPLEAARFVDEFKSPMAAWHFDVGNVAYIAWPDQWIRILGPRVKKLHIKEFSRKKMNEQGYHTGFAVEYLEGDIDWAAVMKAVDDIGYHGWATAEPGWAPKGVDGAERMRQISEKLDKILSA